MKNQIIKAVFLSLLSLAAKAQLFYNKGATIYSDPSAIIKVQGSVTNAVSGLIQHNGLIIIDSTFTNATSATTKGYGVYDVYIDWVNSGSFLRDTSTVNLKGSVQNIMGDSVTRYYNLNLLGSGRKIMWLNSETYNKLNLDINELATQQDTMFLQNPSVSSLLGNFTFGSEAFVSNLDSGAFVRATNNNSAYYYPMGSTAGTARFRPIQITPNNSSNNKYSVSFFNFDATVNTYTVTEKDSTLCYVNDKFYHKVGRPTGASSADLEVGYLASVDNSFNTIGNWKSSNIIWNDIKNVTNTNFIGLYNSNKRLAWTNFSNLPYALANARPVISSVEGNTLICSGNSASYSFSPNPNYSYDWGVTGGTFNNNDSTSSTISITWQSGIGSHFTTLVVTDNTTGCLSLMYNQSVSVGVLPTAGFNLLTPPFTVGNPIFVNDSSINAVNYYYDLGNGTTATTPNAQVAFMMPGSYQIIQIVSDNQGCSDTLVKTVLIDSEWEIPNVFTPNGDGTNDGFTFNCSGCSDYDLDITNRWGQLIYHGNKGSEFWDGTTGTGEQVPEGTYFYILKVQYGSKEKLFKGFVQLFR